MAGRPHQRRLLAALLLPAFVAASASPAQAVDDTVDAHTTGRGVDVSVERFSPGRQVPAQLGTTAARGPRTAAAADCTLFPWVFAPGTAKGGIPPSPQHRRFIVSCDNRVLGTTWIGPADPLAAPAVRAVDIAAVAERVVLDIPVGDITIGHRPRERALTGVPVYVWVDGYDGRPLVRTVDALGVTVDVRLTLRDVSWDFGDGTPTVAAGLGEPWPARSSVHHVYATSTPHQAPATVTAALSLAAEYRVDSGSWQPLAPVTRTATTPLDVDEVQAVRHR